MSLYKYSLEKGSKKFECPLCKEKGKFKRYVDLHSGEYLGDKVGKCDRENSCGYHYTPRQYFQGKIELSSKIINCKSFRNQKIDNFNAYTFIETDIFKRSLNRYYANNFTIYLKRLFGDALAQELIDRYKIGTSKHWNGSTVFWQIDQQGKVRTGKIMLYNPKTGRRVKEPYNHVNWVHKVINKPEFALDQCLFGEHLLANDAKKPVAIVESEKTAIIASAYLPQFLWLGVGGLNELNLEKCRGLKNREVFLFPDAKGYEKWKQKVNTLNSISKFKISDLLETKASDEEKNKGIDIADWLIRHNLSEFVREKTILEMFIDELVEEFTVKGDCNPDKLYFENYEKRGLLATEALTAAYRVSWKTGWKIPEN